MKQLKLFRAWDHTSLENDVNLWLTNYPYYKILSTEFEFVEEAGSTTVYMYSIIYSQ